MMTNNMPLRFFGYNKYKAVKTEIDGFKFASKKEAKRYTQLKLLEKSGAIRDLKIHRRFPLFVNGKLIGHYEADFDYVENDKHVVEDTKGFQTELFKWKWKHCQAQYPDIVWKII